MLSIRVNPVADALKLAILQQVLVLPLAVGIMDGGGIALIYLFAVMAYWGGVFLIRVRRQESFTKIDLVFFRWGFFLLCAISFVLAPVVWKVRGHVE